jgi:hypothetical protein
MDLQLVALRGRSMAAWTVCLTAVQKVLHWVVKRVDMTADSKADWKAIW